MLHLDARAAVRHARRRPGFALAVVGTLALFIGAATTALGLASAVLWRALPFTDASRLVFVWEEVGKDNAGQPSRVTGSRFAAWRDASSRTFSSLALFGSAGFSLDTPNGAISVRGVRVSANYFDTLGIGACLGRTFSREEELPGRERVVVLSRAFWQERFGGSRDAIGKTLLLSGHSFTVIGVMPAVVFPGWPVNPAIVTLDADASQFWIPIVRTPELDRRSAAHVFGAVARLAPGVTAAQARDALNRATDPSAADAHLSHMTPFREQFVRDSRTSLLALAGAALAILLVACANLASLYLTSFEARRAEFAIRMSLGAGRGRLIQQVALEALLLLLAGGVLGVAAARVALARLPSVLPLSLPFLTPPELDARVSVLAVLLTAACATVVTAWPIHRLLSLAPASRGVPQKARAGVYRLLVVAQVSIAMALAVVAALLGHSLHAVRGRDPGFQVANVFEAEIGLPSPGPPDPRRVAAVEQNLLAAVSRVPGVRAAALAYDHPLEANWSEIPTIVGDTTAPESRREAELRIVSPGYFEALGVDILDGRALTAADDFDAPGAVVVNEALARELGGHVVGRQLRTGTPQYLYPRAPGTFEIVGVARNERFRGLESTVRPAFYLSTRQFPQTGFCLLARTQGDPLPFAGAIRAAVRTTDRAMTFDHPTTMERILANQLAARRMTSGVIDGLGGAALALAALGLYGLLAALVAGRTRAIGIRMALGAAPWTIARGVVRESIVSTALGATIGLALSVAAGRLIRGLLVDVSPVDPWTIGTAGGLLVTVSVLSALVPAVRAARVDPVEALRAE